VHEARVANPGIKECRGARAIPDFLVCKQKLFRFVLSTRDQFAATYFPARKEGEKLGGGYRYSEKGIQRSTKTIPGGAMVSPFPVLLPAQGGGIISGHRNSKCATLK